jgi:hypothetical protein
MDDSGSDRNSFDLIFFKLFLYFICAPVAFLFPSLTLYQVYVYLKNGYWLSISVLDFLIFIKIEWAINPVEWAGIAHIFNILPLSITPALFVVFIALIFLKIIEK